MRILVLGATGFIGQSIIVHLAEQGHVTTGLGRSIALAQERFSHIHWIKRDLSTMTTPADWHALLADYDCVVNCAGALQDSWRDNVTAVQNNAMQALYAAAQQQPNPPTIIQISAPAHFAQSNTAFMESKLAADKALAQSGLRYVILRPTVVIGRNAYGGTALLRGLAAMPFALCLAHASSPVNAVHVDDIASTVNRAITGEIPSGSDLVLASAENRSVYETVRMLRAWLGIPAAPLMHIPDSIASIVARFADIAVLLGWRSPLNSTAQAINKLGIATDANAATLLLPDPMPQLMKTPAGAQDVWFARLYLLKPLLIVLLSLFWIASGLIPLTASEQAVAQFQTTAFAPFAWPLTLGTSLLDIALGLAILVQRFAKTALWLMLGVSLAYLVSGTVLQPTLWLDPLGSLVKIFPIMAVFITTLCILEDR